jgi:pyruvyltransferase
MVKVKFKDKEIISDNTQNWGDLIPYDILKNLSKSEKLKNGDVFNVKHPHRGYKIYSTGSVMAFTNTDSIVWGTGCIDRGAVGENPKKIYSVRGPLTRNEMLRRGNDCPEIYGDPALLFPIIYNPKNIEKKYKWGVIPHYIEFESEKDLLILRNLENLGFKIIDICSGKENFINEMLEVENVISSSLHGLIAADAYGIPNARVNISNKLIGGDFKFIDYCLSVERDVDYGLQLTNNTILTDIEHLHLNKRITFDVDEYLKSAPWFSNEFNLF